MRYREAAVSGEFANWTPMFTPPPEGIAYRRQCTKCQKWVDQDKIEEHVRGEHKYDLADGFIVMVDNKWWRHRGVKGQAKES